jgi:hypothetical protein
MFGTWHKFKDVRPSSMDPKPLSYLVIIEGCSEPCTGYYDFFSQRFSVFSPHIGRCLQVPVKWWFAVPYHD